MTHPLKVAVSCTNHPLHKAQNLMTHPLSATPPPHTFLPVLTFPFIRSAFRGRMLLLINLPHWFYASFYFIIYLFIYYDYSFFVHIHSDGKPLVNYNL